MRLLLYILGIPLVYACTQIPNDKSKQIKITENTEVIESVKLDTHFIDLKQYIPTLVIELQYFNSHNFIGKPVNGYLKNRAILTKQAAKKLLNVQQDLKTMGLGLKIYDAYRPQKAVNHFIEWAKDLSDTATKPQYYPNLTKGNLFEAGYISTHSGHTRGSTVDLTLINLKTQQEIDMGSTFDLFDSVSYTFSKKVYPEQSANRKLLRNIMLKHGFYSYIVEWWHFTSWNEPFKDRYFDFDIE